MESIEREAREWRSRQFLAHAAWPFGRTGGAKKRDPEELRADALAMLLFSSREVVSTDSQPYTVAASLTTHLTVLRIDEAINADAVQDATNYVRMLWALVSWMLAPSATKPLPISVAAGNVEENAIFVDAIKAYVAASGGALVFSAERTERTLNNTTVTTPPTLRLAAAVATPEFLRRDALQMQDALLVHGVSSIDILVRGETPDTQRMVLAESIATAVDRLVDDKDTLAVNKSVTVVGEMSVKFARIFGYKQTTAVPSAMARRAAVIAVTLVIDGGAFINVSPKLARVLDADRRSLVLWDPVVQRLRLVRAVNTADAFIVSLVRTFHVRTATVDSASNRNSDVMNDIALVAIDALDAAQSARPRAVKAQTTAMQNILRTLGFVVHGKNVSVDWIRMPLEYQIELRRHLVAALRVGVAEEEGQGFHDMIWNVVPPQLADYDGGDEPLQVECDVAGCGPVMRLLGLDKPVSAAEADDLLAFFVTAEEDARLRAARSPPPRNRTPPVAATWYDRISPDVSKEERARARADRALLADFGWLAVHSAPEVLVALTGREPVGVTPWTAWLAHAVAKSKPLRDLAKSKEFKAAWKYLGDNGAGSESRTVTDLFTMLIAAVNQTRAAKTREALEKPRNIVAAVRAVAYARSRLVERIRRIVADAGVNGIPLPTHLENDFEVLAASATVYAKIVELCKRYERAVTNDAQGERERETDVDEVARLAARFLSKVEEDEAEEDLEEMFADGELDKPMHDLLARIARSEIDVSIPVVRRLQERYPYIVEALNNIDPEMKDTFARITALAAGGVALGGQREATIADVEREIGADLVKELDIPNGADVQEWLSFTSTISEIRRNIADLRIVQVTARLVDPRLVRLAGEASFKLSEDDVKRVMTSHFGVVATTRALLSAIDAPLREATRLYEAAIAILQSSAEATLARRREAMGMLIEANSLSNVLVKDRKLFEGLRGLVTELGESARTLSTTSQQAQALAAAPPAAQAGIVNNVNVAINNYALVAANVTTQLEIAGRDIVTRTEQARSESPRLSRRILDALEMRNWSDALTPAFLIGVVTTSIGVIGIVENVATVLGSVSSTIGISTFGLMSWLYSGLGVVGNIFGIGVYALVAWQSEDVCAALGRISRPLGNVCSAVSNLLRLTSAAATFSALTGATLAPLINAIVSLARTIGTGIAALFANAPVVKPSIENAATELVAGKVGPVVEANLTRVVNTTLTTLTNATTSSPTVYVPFNGTLINATLPDFIPGGSPGSFVPPVDVPVPVLPPGTPGWFWGAVTAIASYIVRSKGKIGITIIGAFAVKALLAAMAPELVPLFLTSVAEYASLAPAIVLELVYGKAVPVALQYLLPLAASAAVRNAGAADGRRARTGQHVRRLAAPAGRVVVSKASAARGPERSGLREDETRTASLAAAADGGDDDLWA